MTELMRMAGWWRSLVIWLRLHRTACNPKTHVTHVIYLTNSTPEEPCTRAEVVRRDSLPFPLSVLFGVVWCSLVLFGPKIYFCFLPTLNRQTPACQASAQSFVAPILSNSEPKSSELQSPFRYASSSRITSPCTSVSRRSAPLCRNVSSVWSIPSRWRTVA